ncbi:hypothetical protein L596_017853 [Steinernema carpocapsae]|uniref:Uncharacterized protein n=1 Tax=Steinernema carpocapsae TaxID=34508 RepID=A0A4U5N2W2_STECR|nr:hypothetical protein L596_017853 [Steinernema carpocapsae]
MPSLSVAKGSRRRNLRRSDFIPGLHEEPPFEFDFSKSLLELCGIRPIKLDVTSIIEGEQLHPPMPSSSVAEGSRRRNLRRSDFIPGLHEEPPFEFDFSKSLLELCGIQPIQPPPKVESVREEPVRVSRTGLDDTVFLDALADPKPASHDKEETVVLAKATNVGLEAEETITYEQFGSQPFVASTPHIPIKRLSEICETPPSRLAKSQRASSLRGTPPRKLFKEDEATIPIASLDLTPAASSLPKISEDEAPKQAAEERLDVTPKIEEGHLQLPKNECDATIQMEVDPVEEEVEEPFRTSQKPEPKTPARPVAYGVCSISDVSFASIASVSRGAKQIASEQTAEEPLDVTPKIGEEQPHPPKLFRYEDEAPIPMDVDPVEEEPSILNATVIDDITIMEESTSEPLRAAQKPEPKTPARPVAYGVCSISDVSFASIASVSRGAKQIASGRVAEERLDVTPKIEEEQPQLPKPVDHPFGKLRTIVSFKTPGREQRRVSEVDDFCGDSIAFSLLDTDSSGILGDVSSADSTIRAPKARKIELDRKPLPVLQFDEAVTEPEPKEADSKPTEAPAPLVKEEAAPAVSTVEREPVEEISISSSKEEPMKPRPLESELKEPRQAEVEVAEFNSFREVSYADQSLLTSALAVSLNSTKMDVSKLKSGWNRRKKKAEERRTPKVPAVAEEPELVEKPEVAKEPEAAKKEHKAWKAPEAAEKPKKKPAKRKSMAVDPAMAKGKMFTTGSPLRKRQAPKTKPPKARPVVGPCDIPLPELRRSQEPNETERRSCRSRSRNSVEPPEVPLPKVIHPKEPKSTGQSSLRRSSRNRVPTLSRSLGQRVEYVYDENGLPTVKKLRDSFNE